MHMDELTTSETCFCDIQLADATSAASSGADVDIHRSIQAVARLGRTLISHGKTAVRRCYKVNMTRGGAEVSELGPLAKPSPNVLSFWLLSHDL